MKKIGKKHEGLDDSIDSIWVEEFPIKPKRYDLMDEDAATNMEPFGNVKISPRKNEQLQDPIGDYTIPDSVSKMDTLPNRSSPGWQDGMIRRNSKTPVWQGGQLNWDSFQITPPPRDGSIYSKNWDSEHEKDDKSMQGWIVW